ncbi:hypothetical protein HCN44_006517 [Aphidius gifuensis]|uniref:Uncharacterized protein n=2 Tax=Aphidius gifuensis TaxID=684658 RepID=A0A834Y0E6_APHGI|nr:hypothetical protein HCN44_006517 [Aphidius gifuensis]
MIPWLCIQFGGLFLFAGCNLAWLFTGHYFASRFEVMLGHVFGLFMLTMYIYIFMVLLSYYKLLTDKQVVTKKNSGRVYDASFVPNAPFESV